MWEYIVERSITIHCPRAKVWKEIVSFDRQALWSPWIIIESSCARSIEWEDGQEWTIDRWDWEIIWSWERENLEIIEEDYLNQELRFKRPFKSTARCYFTLQKCGPDCTEVIWGMKGKLPWFSFFMKSMMQRFISADYDRGLKMLKVLCETGKLETSIEDRGISEVWETYFLSRDHVAHMDEVWPIMHDDFTRLAAFCKNEDINILSVRSYYPKVDFKNSIFTFRSVIEISKEDYEHLETLPKEIVKWYYPAVRVYSLRHKGSYDFLANTWTGVFMYLRTRKMKSNKQVPPFELYINAPLNTEAKDLLTDVSAPIK